MLAVASSSSVANAPASAAAAAAAAEADKAGPIVSHVIWGGQKRAYAHQGLNVTFRDWSSSGESGSHQQSNHSDPVVAQGLTRGSNSSSRPICNSGSGCVATLPDAGNDKAQEIRELLARDGVWSIGSEKHCEGTCRPCHYSHTVRGCSSGQNCRFCHMPHVQTNSKSRNRLSKTKRDQCKKVFNVVASMDFCDDAQMSHVVHNVACQSSYMHNMLRHSKLLGHEQQPAPSEEHNSANAGLEAGVQPMMQTVSDGCELQNASSALPSHGHRRSLVAL